jgi:hypothetical protein
MAQVDDGGTVATRRRADERGQGKSEGETTNWGVS